jgi:hypothetical protein
MGENEGEILLLLCLVQRSVDFLLIYKWYLESTHFTPYAYDE